MSTTMPVTSDQIIEALAARHAEDVFVPECKGGPTWSAEHLRMDAWAMRKSWSRPVVWAYEVKCSRGDFLRDDKWHGYLAYCNEFYFVCPSGVIQPAEVPDSAGLLYVTTTGTRLFTKRKAPRRDVSIPEELWRYVLMSRVAIKGEERPDERPCPRLEYWKEWLARKAESRHVGYEVSRAVAAHVTTIEHENARLKNENAALALFRQRLHELGVNPEWGIDKWAVERELDRLLGKLPAWLPRTLDSLERGIQQLREVIQPPQPQPRESKEPC